MRTKPGQSLLFSSLQISHTLVYVIGGQREESTHNIKQCLPLMDQAIKQESQLYFFFQEHQSLHKDRKQTQQDRFWTLIQYIF
jgi:hypothetical protein